MASGAGTAGDPRIYTMATETANGSVNNTALIDECSNDATIGALVQSNMGTDEAADKLSVAFTTTPTAGEITALDAVVLAHTGAALAAPTMEVSGTDTISTTSTTDVLATGMTITPPAGDYLVSWSGSKTTNQNALSYVSIWLDGAQVARSERRGLARDHEDAFVTHARVTVDGTQAIEGRWRSSGNSQQVDMFTRQLILVKV